MTGEEWAALDEPASTPTTMSREQWDALDQPAATPGMSKDQWDALDSSSPPTPQPTPQGQIIPGNIDLHSRPVVKNADGSISTVKSMGIGTDQGETVIPQVAEDGSRVLSEAEAIDQFRRTGKHLGIFGSVEDANAYGDSLHKDQAREYLPTPVPRETPAAPIATSVPEDFYSSMKARQGGLAALGGEQPESTVDWSTFTPPTSAEETLVKEKGDDPLAFLSGVLRNEQSKIPNATKPAPWALPIIASVAAPETLAWQTGASLAGGAAGRYAEGQPVLDKVAMLKDLLAPAGVNVALGVGKELATPLMKYLHPDLAEATNDITKGWANLGDVNPTGAAQQVLPDKNRAQAAIDVTKDIVGSPIERGAASKIQELKDVSKRLLAYAHGRNRIDEYITRRGNEIFTQPKEGILGKLGQRTEIPLADREDMKLLLEGHKTIDQVSPLAAERAPLLKKFYDEFGDLGDQWGVFHPGAPRVRARFGTPDPAYTGPNIPQNPEDAKQYIEDMTRLGHEGKRTTGFHERVEHKYFEPSIHVHDPLEGFNLYKKTAPEIYASHYAFGAPGEYTPLAKAAEGFGQRTLAPGASVAKSTAGLIEQRIPGATVAEGGTKAFGRDVNELLNRASSQDLAPHERATLESLTDSIKQIYHTGERSPGAALAGKVVGTTLLPLSWWNQFNQTAWNVAKPGLQDFTRGLVRYARDPDFRALIQASGGKGSSYEHLFNQIRGDTGFGEDVLALAKERLPERMSRGLDLQMGRVRESPLGRMATKATGMLPENTVGSAIGWSEGKLRGVLGAGHYVHNEGLIQQALDAAAGGGRLSRGLSRELAEAGIDETELLRNPEYASSAHTIRNAGATSTGRYQLMSGDPGHSSARIIGNPWGRVAAQFKSFPLGTARLFKNDVLDPIMSGFKSRDLYNGRLDLSELSLGAGRLARLIPAAAVSTGVAMTGKQILQGKGPADWAYDDLPAQAARDVIGMPADLATRLYEGTDPTTGEWSPSRGAWEAGKTLLPPVVSLMSRPSWGRLGLLGANAMMPKLGSMATMLSPPFLKAGEPDEDPRARLLREIDQLKNRSRNDIERLKKSIRP